MANEVQLLKMLISDQNGATVQFKLAPAYALYMVARQHLSPDFVSESDRQVSLVHMLKSTCSLVRKAVKVRQLFLALLLSVLSLTPFGYPFVF